MCVRSSSTSRWPRASCSARASMLWGQRGSTRLRSRAGQCDWGGRSFRTPQILMVHDARAPPHICAGTGMEPEAAGPRFRRGACPSRPTAPPQTDSAPPPPRPRRASYRTCRTDPRTKPPAAARRPPPSVVAEVGRCLHAARRRMVPCPVPAQGCGRGEPSSGADVGGSVMEFVPAVARCADADVTRRAEAARDERAETEDLVRASAQRQRTSTTIDQAASESAHGCNGTYNMARDTRHGTRHTRRGKHLAASESARSRRSRASSSERRASSRSSSLALMPSSSAAALRRASSRCSRAERLIERRPLVPRQTAD